LRPGINKEHTVDTASAAGANCDVRGADLERVEVGRRELLDDETYARLAETFRTLADSSRAKIVHSLLKQELCTCDLAAITGHSEPAVSQHLRLLRCLQLVKTRREGKKVYYSLADAHVRFLLTVTLQHLQHEEEPTSPPDPLPTEWREGTADRHGGRG
jgi:ArsR family transcriptional regulator, lead/cadmium/zinc/bismuth-responsive transcriptional repressor